MWYHNPATQKRVQEEKDGNGDNEVTNMCSTGEIHVCAV